MAKNDVAAEASSFLMIRGLVSVLFGVVALAWPGLTARTLALFVMIWLVVVGIVSIVQGVKELHMGWSAIGRILLGILQIGVGAYLIRNPELNQGLLVGLIALVLVVEGALAIVVSLVQKDEYATVKMIGILGGALSMVAGVLIWQYPVGGALAFVWLLGLSAIISGTLSIAMAADIKK